MSDVAYELTCFLLVYVAVNRRLSQYSVSIIGGLWSSEKVGAGLNRIYTPHIYN
jgi:hypothetical protein